MGARLLLALVLALPTFVFGQAFNGNFETILPNGLPVGWSHADPSGASTSSDAHLGKRAIKAWVYRNYVSGIWDGTANAVDGNASEVTGYYQYTGDKKECQPATVSYLLGARNELGKIDTMAYGDVELKLNKDYKKFSLQVEAKSSGQPDFMAIQIMPHGRCNIHGASNCCYLLVDDIILAGNTSIQAPAPVAVPVEDSPKSKQPAKEEAAKEEMPPVEEIAPLVPLEIEESPVEEMAPEEEVVPVEEPAIEESIPTEEEFNEPTEEGWDTEDQSSDNG